MTDIRRARTAFVWVGVIVPVAVLVVTSVMIAIWLPELPDPVAIHWGTEGVNGYGPPWTYLALTLGVGGGMVALCAGIALFSPRLPQSSRTQLPAGASVRSLFLAGSCSRRSRRLRTLTSASRCR